MSETVRSATAKFAINTLLMVFMSGLQTASMVIKLPLIPQKQVMLYATNRSHFRAAFSSLSSNSDVADELLNKVAFKLFEKFATDKTMSSGGVDKFFFYEK